MLNTRWVRTQVSEMFHYHDNGSQHHPGRREDCPICAGSGSIRSFRDRETILGAVFMPVIALVSIAVLILQSFFR